MITVIFTKVELENLAGLMDAGVKSIGLRAARQAADLADKLQKAIEKSEKENNK